MAKLEEAQDDVLVQGMSYQPEMEDNDDILDASTSAKPKKEKGKLNVVVIIIVVIVFILIVVGVILGATKIMKNGDKSGGDELFEQLEEMAFEYTPVEISLLREAGYTGSEIEDYQMQEVDASQLIKQSEDAITKRYEELVAPYFDNRSEEYKELEEYTWLGGAEFEYKDADDWQLKGAVKNVDYVKVPLRGYQCWLRVEITRGNAEKGTEPTYAFMYIEPTRYRELADDGNINIEFEYWYSKSLKQNIIIDIKEKRVTDN